MPDAGVPVDLVDAARRIVENNRRMPSAKRRFWELAGGLLRCDECGGHMRPVQSAGRKGYGVWYFYYRCARQFESEGDTCA